MFLGVCRRLAERGCRVRAFVLPGDRATQYLPSGVEVVEGDLCDTASLDRLFDTPLVAKHGASMVTLNPDYNPTLVKVNVEGTEHMIAQCVRRTRAMTSCLPKLMERRVRHTGKPPVLTSFSIYNLARNNRYDYSKARRELGCTTRPYAETVRDEVRRLETFGHYQPTKK